MPIHLYTHRIRVLWRDLSISLHLNAPPQLPAMTSLRSARINDLLRMSLTNLDPLTENYDLGFYSHYLAKWPSLFIIAEDTRGDIIGYSAVPLRPRHSVQSFCLPAP